jgi:hypothetical protein
VKHKRGFKMKKEMYIVFDKTEKNFRKPLVGIFQNSVKAEQEVTKLKNRLQLNSQKLISMDKVIVEDFDSNKSNVFMVWDKTRKENNIHLFSEMKNATTALQTFRRIVDNANAVTMTSEKIL